MKLGLAVSLSCSLTLVLTTPVAAATEIDLTHPVRILVSDANAASQQPRVETAGMLTNQRWRREQRGTDELWIGHLNSTAELQSLLDSFVADGARYAVLDERRHPHAAPSDPICTS